MSKLSDVAGLAVLEAVRYGSHSYPVGVEPVLDEVPAHFDIKTPKTLRPYSMHTEYAAGVRRFDSPLLADLDVILSSSRRGVPELWTSEEWSKELAEFVRRFAATGLPPSVVEVHPPFRRYCGDVSDFLGTYEVFERDLAQQLPNAEIVIENRRGSRYGGRFLVSTVADLLELIRGLQGCKLRLRIALDIPQLLSAEAAGESLSSALVARVFRSLATSAAMIRTIHIWGRRRAAHVGTLDDLVGRDQRVKEALLQGMLQLLGDGRPRLLVPEVNSGQEDFTAIIQDLQEAGFHFQ